MKLPVCQKMTIRAASYAKLNSDGSIMNNDWYAIIDFYMFISRQNWLLPKIEEVEKIDISVSMEPSFSFNLPGRYKNAIDAINAATEFVSKYEISSTEPLTFINEH